MERTLPSHRRNITSAIKHHNPDVGARRAVPRLGEARLAPTIDMFNCPRNNEWTAQGKMPIEESINPATGKVMQVFEEWSAFTTDSVIEEVHDSWPGWRDSSIAERAVLMRRAADILRLHAGEYAELMALEMGKPLAQGRAEVEKCAWGCEYYADHAAGYLADEPAESDGSRAFVRVPAAGVGAGGHALELSLLAGLPLRGSGPHGRQCGGPEALLQCAALRPGHRGCLPQGRLSGEYSSEPC